MVGVALAALILATRIMILIKSMMLPITMLAVAKPFPLYFSGFLLIFFKLMAPKMIPSRAKGIPNSGTIPKKERIKPASPSFSVFG